MILLPFSFKPLIYAQTWKKEQQTNNLHTQAKKYMPACTRCEITRAHIFLVSWHIQKGNDIFSPFAVNPSRNDL